MMDAVRSRGTIYLLNPEVRRWERLNLMDNVPPVLIPGAGVSKLIINNQGQILLSLFLDNQKPLFRSFVWDRGRIHDLGGQDMDVDAASMNDAGQVVGKVSPVKGSGWTPVIRQDGAFYDLSRLLLGNPGIEIKKVRQINNKGWILCDGEDARNAYTLILRPVNSAPASATSVRVATRP
jgi:hypothetical protein